MASPFETLDYNKALQLLLDYDSEDVEKSQKYYDGDHWMDGEGWKGPQFKGTDEISLTVKDGVERDFTSKNVIRSVVKRHRRGIVGREPGWIISVRRTLGKVRNAEGEMVDAEPNAEEMKRIEEANSYLLEWWNEHLALLVFRKAITNLLVGGRGTLRLYIPPAELKTREGGRPFIPKMMPEKAIKIIYPLAPKREEATVITDVESMKKVSIFLYKTKEGKQRIEVSYVDDDGRTVFRILDQEGSIFSRAIDAGKQLIGRLLGEGPAVNEWKFQMGGKLFITQMENDPLVTRQIQENQALVAKGLTNLSHNMDLAGFRETTYLNAQPPGRKILVDDPARPGTKVEAFVAGIMPVGAGSRGFVQGISYVDKDKDGKSITRLATPSRIDTEPIPVKSFDDTAAIGTRNILEEADQMHVLIQGDTTASGESRKQARDEHEKSLKETKPVVDYGGSEVCEGVLALIAILIGKPGYFDGLRVSMNTKIDPGPLSAEDRRINIEEKKERIRSREDAMQQANVDDPDAMKSKIREEEKEDREAQSPPDPTSNDSDPAKDKTNHEGGNDNQ